MPQPAAAGGPGGGGPSAAAAAAAGQPPPVLPFGRTLHYTGCGCPFNWAPGCRLCDWGDSWVSQAHASLEPLGGGGGGARLSPIRPLRVGLCIPHANVTGGLKQLLEQARLLRQRGHHVVALTRSEVADTAVPAWSDVQVDEDVVCRLGQRFRDAYDVDALDAVITGIFHQVPEWLIGTTAPVLYYEQGHEWLFGDPMRFQDAGDYAAQDHLFHQAMHLPVALAAVSEGVQRIIRQEFGRSSVLIHNGVDSRRFSPVPRAAAALARGTPLLRLCSAGQACAGAGFRSSLEQQLQSQQQAQQRQQEQQGAVGCTGCCAPMQQAARQWLLQLPPPPALPRQGPGSHGPQQQQQQQQRRRPSVLLVGNPGLSLKGFECAVATLTLVNLCRPIDVHWVCQQPPSPGLAAKAVAAGLRVSLHVDPPQAALPALYRGHDCFLFTSKYEAWGMPVLEAMASGLPVVATDTAGVCSFGTHGGDCLLAPPGDARQLAQHVLSVLQDGGLAARLASAARQTALRYTPDRVAQQLERVLYSLTACRQELLSLRLQALPDSQRAAAAAVRACSGVAAAQQAQGAAKRAAVQQAQQGNARAQQQQQEQQSVGRSSSSSEPPWPSPSLAASSCAGAGTSPLLARQASLGSPGLNRGYQSAPALAGEELGLPGICD